MLSATDQIARIEAMLVDAGGRLLEPSDVVVSNDDLSADARIGVVYAMGHTLHATLTIDLSYGYPNWVVYGFHFQDGQNRTVFRYDNWAYHPEVETFPHHKHVGPNEVIEAHLQPSLAAIIREISEYI